MSRWIVDPQSQAPSMDDLIHMRVAVCRAYEARAKEVQDLSPADLWLLWREIPETEERKR